MRRRAALAALAGGLLARPALAACEGVVPGLRPQNTARDYIGNTLDEITERGWIEIAVYEEFAPYSWAEGGEPMGIDVEVARIVAAGLGVEARVRLVQAGENLQADLLNYVWKGTVQNEKVANLMLRVPYNVDFACRVEQVVFTGVYATEEIAIAYSRAAYPEAVAGAGRHEGAPVPAFFRYDTVAVENDSIADFYLTGLGAGDKMRRFPTMAEGMAALRAGAVMAAMGPRSQLEYGADAGVAVHVPPLPGFSLSRWPVGLALHHSHRDLGYAAGDAVAAAVADGRIAAAQAKFGVGWVAPE
jgi:ABC-type amino acid transport substrate-binding protein